MRGIACAILAIGLLHEAHTMIQQGWATPTTLLVLVLGFAALGGAVVCIGRGL
jgi:hypothetical protein